MEKLHQDPMLHLGVKGLDDDDELTYHNADNNRILPELSQKKVSYQLCMSDRAVSEMVTYTYRLSFW
jgi:hypothetical protein